MNIRGRKCLLAVTGLTMLFPAKIAGQQSLGLVTEFGPMYVRAFSGNGVAGRLSVAMSPSWMVFGATAGLGVHGSIGTVHSPSVWGTWMRVRAAGLHLSLDWELPHARLRPHVTLVGESMNARWGSSIFKPICYVTPEFPDCVPRGDTGLAGGVGAGTDVILIRGLYGRLRVTRKWSDLRLPNDGAMWTGFFGLVYDWAAIP